MVEGLDGSLLEEGDAVQGLEDGGVGLAAAVAEAFVGGDDGLVKPGFGEADRGGDLVGRAGAEQLGPLWVGRFAAEHLQAHFARDGQVPGNPYRRMAVPAAGGVEAVLADVSEDLLEDADLEFIDGAFGVEHGIAVTKAGIAV